MTADGPPGVHPISDAHIHPATLVNGAEMAPYISIQNAAVDKETRALNLASTSLATEAGSSALVK
jgi:hypothetical protein